MMALEAKDKYDSDLYRLKLAAFTADPPTYGPIMFPEFQDSNADTDLDQIEGPVEFELTGMMTQQEMEKVLAQFNATR